MYTKLINLICFVLVLSLVGNAQAVTIWTDAAPGDHLWSTADNWDDGLPDSEDWAKVRNGLPGPTIDFEGAVAEKVHIGYDPNSALAVVDGGSLTMLGDLRLGKNGGSGTLNMIGGTISVGGDLDVGGGDPGIVNMTGGTITVADDIEMPDEAGSTAEVNLNGGTIFLSDDLQMGEGGILDINAGTLIIDGNAVSDVQGYIDDGLITAYGGDGTVQVDYDVTNLRKTTVKGVHYLKPNPIDGGSAAPGALELSWALPDPCVPNEPVLVDVYFTEDWAALYSFTDPAAIRVISMQNVTSVAVQIQPMTRYYWAVDTYLGGDDPNNNPILGPIFSFVAGNQAPRVDAGPDLLTWPGEDGTRTKALDATITDEEAYTVQWTVFSEPNDPNNPDAVIADPSAEDTSITLSALGEYVLQLDATDGEKTGSDTVMINVYEDGCEAAKSLPDYEPFPGDLNGDCKVDDLDLAILNEDWLKDNSLTEP